MSQLMDLYEDLTLPNNQRATVARFATRFFVLVGDRAAPRSESDVRGPFDTRIEATRRARILQQNSYEPAETEAV